MAIRTKTQIITDAITFITEAIPNIATFVGSVVRDLVIESPAEEFENVYEELEHTQKLQSATFATDQTTEELDALALNYGLTRLPGTAATGVVTFQIRNFSTSSAPISIPTGTVVGTLGADDIAQATFLTTQAFTFNNLLAPSYFNPISGLYEQVVPIVADNIGANANVAAGTVTQLISSIPGIFSITNTVATTGGTDIESNEDFGERITVRLSGNSVGTPSGIISTARANANVIDAIVVTPNDAEMIRDEFGGEVDVYVIGEIESSTESTILYEAAGPQDFVLQHQPARSVSSVTGIVAAAPYTFVENIDFQFVEDPSTLFNGSIRLENRIVFDIGGTNPDDATAVTITYTYNSLIEDLQTDFNQDDAHIVTTDILVKEATEVLIGVEADVSLFPGYVAADVIADTQTALTNYINALGLGDSIDRSDIIGIIEEVEGVDSVNVSTLILTKDNIPIPALQQRLQVTKVEYPRTSPSLVINIV